MTLDRISDGLYRATAPISGQGAYRLSNGDVSTITAIGALNPREYSNLLPTTNLLSPHSNDSGGLIASIGLDPETRPNIRRVKAGRKTSGESWMGLIAHEQYNVTQSRRSPLAPTFFLFILFFIFIALAWRREGK